MDCPIQETVDHFRSTDCFGIVITKEMKQRDNRYGDESSNKKDRYTNEHPSSTSGGIAQKELVTTNLY